MSLSDKIREAKTGTGTVAKIVEENTNEIAGRINQLKLQQLLDEQEERSAARKNRPSSGTSSVISAILKMAEVDPEKAKAFLDRLDEQSINKLAQLYAVETGKAEAFLNIAKSSSTNIQDLVAVAKLMGNGGDRIDLKGIAEIFKLGIDVAKNQNQPQNDPMENVKSVMETFVNPFLNQLQEKDRQLVEERYKHLEEKIVSTNPLEFVRSQKALAQELGFGQQKNITDQDLKLEQMRQSHDIDMAALGWEQQKTVSQMQSEKEKWDSIRETFEPVFSMAAPEVRGALHQVGKSIGKALQIEEGEQRKEESSKALEVTAVCDGCNGEIRFTVPPNAPDPLPVKCSICGKMLSFSKSQEQTKIPEPPKMEPQSQVEEPRGISLKAKFR